MKRTIAVIFSLVVFAVGVSMYVAAAAKKHVEPARGFVITYAVTQTPPNGAPSLEEIETLLVQSSGDGKRSRYFVNQGSALTHITNHGIVFSVTKNSLEFQGLKGSPEREEFFRSPYFHKTHPEFVRMDSVAGLQVYVHHAESGGTSVETYFAAEIGLAPLKTVIETSDGFKVTTEALSVQFRDVGDNEVALPSVPISFEKAQGRIATSSPDTARVLSDQVAEAKQRLSAK